MKNYLVTGGAGFIGSNYVLYMLNKYNDVKIDNQLGNLFKEHNFDYVVNFAVESHVDRSVRELRVFSKTNAIGIVNQVKRELTNGKGIQRYFQNANKHNQIFK